jgi:hypothetical protein
MMKTRRLNPEQARPRARRQWLAACIAVGALLPVVADAQVPAVVTLKAGLQTVAGGNTLVLTITEVGASDSSSTVTIEFLDARDQRRAFKSAATLQRGRPVHLRLQLPTAVGYDQLRPIVTITPLANPHGSRPIVGLEELEVQAFRVVTKGGSCALFVTDDHDTTKGSGAQPSCPGWELSLTAK